MALDGALFTETFFSFFTGQPLSVWCVLTKKSLTFHKDAKQNRPPISEYENYKVSVTKRGFFSQAFVLMTGENDVNDYTFCL
jgi:hypothetical protein